MTTTFENAKVNDKVWCMRRGWGEIIHTLWGTRYPIQVIFPNGAFGTFTLGGLVNTGDTYQTLFWDEVKIKAPEKLMSVLPELPVDTKVIVWYDNMPKYKRYFSHFSPSGRVVCFDYGLTSWTTVQATEWDNWELAE